MMNCTKMAIIVICCWSILWWSGRWNRWQGHIRNRKGRWRPSYIHGWIGQVNNTFVWTTSACFNQYDLHHTIVLVKIDPENYAPSQKIRAPTTKFVHKKTQAGESISMCSKAGKRKQEVHNVLSNNKEGGKKRQSLRASLSMMIHSVPKVI